MCNCKSKLLNPVSTPEGSVSIWFDCTGILSVGVLIDEYN